jgi:hypothetical protein
MYLLSLLISLRKRAEKEAGVNRRGRKGGTGNRNGRLVVRAKIRA